MVTKVTLKDVAEDAGVSKSTASLVLNSSPRISDGTRQRVLASVKKLGYVPNLQAASLRTQQSFTIGLAITDITNPFYAELTSGIEMALMNANYIPLLGSTSDDLEHQDRLLDTMLGRSVDGIVLCPARGTRPENLEQLMQRVPTVLVTRYISGVDADYVGIDNELGARRAVSHLIEKGHSRIAFIGGPIDSSARQDRMAGYISMLEKHDIVPDPALMVASAVTRQGGFEAIQAVLELEERPTAALCYNDVVAFGTMLGLNKIRKMPGEDFAVVGFDDVAEAALWSPALTTIAGTPHLMGEEAAKLLLARIVRPDRSTRQVILPSQLIIRESS